VSVYFFDSSALVKRYVTEPGSAWIRRITTPTARNHIIIARVTWVETLSALARRRREGSLSSTDVSQVIRNLRHDFDTQYQVAEVNRQLVEKDTIYFPVPNHPSSRARATACAWRFTPSLP
jgi:predicted nucleic acid-binding protein